MIGHCDMVFPRWPTDVCKMQMMEYRVPGNGIPDDQIAQIVEKEIMTTNFDAAYYPAFDLFSLVRSLDNFFYDLFEKLLICLVFSNLIVILIKCY